MTAAAPSSIHTHNMALQCVIGWLNSCAVALTDIPQGKRIVQELPLGELSEVRARNYAARGSVSGAPDLFFFCAGRVLGIEVKVGRDKLRPAQANYRARLLGCGIHTLLIRSNGRWCGTWRGSGESLSDFNKRLSAEAAHPRVFRFALGGAVDEWGDAVGLTAGNKSGND